MNGGAVTMVLMIVTCAGCGRRYRGTPGSKRYRCAHCHNILTFPGLTRAAAPGKALCSNCWSATDSHHEPIACPACGERIGTRDGGRAALPGLFSNAEEPLPFNEEDEKLIRTARELEVRIVAAQVAAVRGCGADTPASGERGKSQAAAAESSGSQHQVEAPRDETAKACEQAVQLRDEALKSRDEALALVRQLQAQRAGMQSELDHLRSAALTAPEPLDGECARRMQEMAAEMDGLHALIAQAREDLNQRLNATERAVGDMRGHLAAACRELNKRLVRATGAHPRQGERVPVSTFAASGPLAELLAAGVPPGAALIVSRYAPAGGRGKAPAA